VNILQLLIRLSDFGLFSDGENLFVRFARDLTREEVELTCPKCSYHNLTKSH